MTSEINALVYSEEALLAKRVRDAKGSGSILSSHNSLWLLWALPPPHTSDLSKEAPGSFMQMDGLWDSSLDGTP